MKRTLTVLLVTALALAGLAAPAAAADNAPALSRIVTKGEIHVGMSGDQPPFCMKSKDGKLIGYDVDLAGLLANAMGVTLKIEVMPFAELLPALEAGRIDAVMSGMTMTPKRNLRAAFVGPYVVSGKTILTTDATLAKASDTKDLDITGMTVVVLAGSTSEAFAKRAMHEAKIVPVPDYETGVAKVLEGKANFMVADRPILALTVLRHPDKGLVLSDQLLSIEPIGIALPAGDSLMLNMVENYVSTLDAIGLLDNLQKKWFESGDWLAQIK